MRELEGGTRNRGKNSGGGFKNWKIGGLTIRKEAIGLLDTPGARGPIKDTKAQA